MRMRRDDVRWLSYGQPRPAHQPGRSRLDAGFLFGVLPARLFGTTVFPHAMAFGAAGNLEYAEKFGRIHHLPAAQLAAVIDGMRDRGLIGDDGWLSEPGRAVRQRVEALTDDLAARPYQSLEPDELDELMATLEPLATLLLAAQDW